MDEIERIEAEAGRDRRARSQRQDDAAEHDRADGRSISRSTVHHRAEGVGWARAPMARSAEVPAS